MTLRFIPRPVVAGERLCPLNAIKPRRQSTILSITGAHRLDTFMEIQADRRAA